MADQTTVRVTIETKTGKTSLSILVPQDNINSEKHCRQVLASGVEMSCALLDAVYKKDDSDD